MGEKLTHGQIACMHARRRPSWLGAGQTATTRAVRMQLINQARCSYISHVTHSPMHACFFLVRELPRASFGCLGMRPGTAYYTCFVFPIGLKPARKRMLFVLGQPRNGTGQERPIPNLEHLEPRPHLLTCGTHPFQPARGGVSSPTLASREEAAAEGRRRRRGGAARPPPQRRRRRHPVRPPRPRTLSRDAKLATKLRREVAAWRREITEWRRDASSTANTPLPASTSSAAFSPVSSRVLSSPIPMG
jgi:hypothetical protein